MNRYHITVEKALFWGRIICVYMPIIFFLAVPPLIFFILLDLNAFSVIGGILGGFACAWIWWSFAVTRWRIWAFSNVRNIHELRRKAVNEKIIHPQGSWFEKTEVKTQLQKQILRELERRFKENDIYYDDPAIPDLATICYSKWKAWWEITIGVALIIFGAYILTGSNNDKSIYPALFIFAIAIWICISGIRKLRNRKPVLLINDIGIKIKEAHILTWGHIDYYDIDYQSKVLYLNIYHDRGTEKIEIDSLAISRRRLQYLLDIYYKRHSGILVPKVGKNYSTILKLLVVFLWLAGCQQKSGNVLVVDGLRDGDIIFQESQSAQSKAIQLATGSRYSHCGIIYKTGEDYFVYEAIQPIQTTPLDEWVARGKDGHYVVKRLKKANHVLTPQAIAKMKKVGSTMKGRQYDLYFEWSDDRIYCSELIWKIYKEGAGIEVGALQQLKDFDLSSPGSTAKAQRALWQQHSSG